MRVNLNDYPAVATRLARIRDKHSEFYRVNDTEKAREFLRVIPDGEEAPRAFAAWLQVHGDALDTFIHKN